MIFLSLGAVILVADWITKRMVAASIEPHGVVRIVGDWVRLTFIQTPGAAFGLFPGSRPVLVTVSVVAVIIVVTVAWRRSTRLHTILPLGLILGGAIGNLVDRVLAGQVVDFIQIGIPPDLYWPVFNVADSAVTVGVLWLAAGLVFWGREEGAEASADEPGAAGEAGDAESPGPEEPPHAMAPSRDER